MKGYSVFDRKKVIAIILAALIAIAVVATLYATLLPLQSDSSANEPDFTPQDRTIKLRIGETFYNSYGNIIFTNIFAKPSLTINDTEYSGYYLIASAVATSEKFLTDKDKTYGVLRKNWEEENPSEIYEEFSFNLEFSSALSMSRSQSDEEESNSEAAKSSDFSGGKSNALLILNYVFELTKEQYDFLYELRDAYDTEQNKNSLPDIRLKLGGCGYLASPGIRGQAYAVFSFSEVRFEEELQ